MRYSAFERNRVELPDARRNSRRAGIAAFSMRYRLSSALQGADLADAGNVSSVPLDPELHVLVGIEAGCVHGKLRCSHDSFSSGLKLGFDLSGHLLQVQDHEFSRLQRGKPHPDVHDAKVAVVLRRGFCIALYKISILWRAPLESSLTKQVVHERANVQTNLGLERLVVWLEDNPLQPAVQALFHE